MKFYVNKKTKKIHRQNAKGTGCRKAEIVSKNVVTVTSKEVTSLIKEGYTLCKHCEK